MKNYEGIMKKYEGNMKTYIFAAGLKEILGLPRGALR